jgi:prolyl-tRNA synthetase
LTAEGLAVVVDDRDSSPGVRFADADLIGVPHRVTIGKRLEKDGVISIKQRGVEGEQDVPVADGLSTILAAISA